MTLEAFFFGGSLIALIALATIIKVEGKNDG